MRSINLMDDIQKELSKEVEKILENYTGFEVYELIEGVNGRIDAYFQFSIRDQYKKYIDDIWKTKKMIMYIRTEIFIEKVLEKLVAWEERNSNFIKIPVSDNMYNNISLKINEFEWKKKLDILYKEDSPFKLGSNNLKEYDEEQLRRFIHNRDTYSNLDVNLDNTSRYFISCKNIYATMFMHLYDGEIRKELVRLQEGKTFNVDVFVPLYGEDGRNRLYVIKENEEIKLPPKNQEERLKRELEKLTKGGWDGYNPMERYLYEKLFGYSLYNCICLNVENVYAKMTVKKVRELFLEQLVSFANKMIAIPNTIIRVHMADILLKPFMVASSILNGEEAVSVLKKINHDCLSDQQIENKLHEISSYANRQINIVDEYVANLCENIVRERDGKGIENEYVYKIYWEVIKSYTLDRDNCKSSLFYVGYDYNMGDSVLVKNYKGDKDYARLEFSKELPIYAHFNYLYDTVNGMPEKSGKGNKRKEELRQEIFRQIYLHGE